jgi:glutathione S-transferase
MILIGMFDSPFVRRVAVSLNLLGIAFEHRNWSVGNDFELIRHFNPLGRVPVLVQPNGETIIDSSAILDFIDEEAGERALLPRMGAPRREALRAIAVALGAAEKGMQQIYEAAFRPEAKRHPPWVERCRTQMQSALTELDRIAQSRPGGWLVGAQMTQADVTTACMFTALIEGVPLTQASTQYPGLSGLTARCEALPAFRSVKVPFQPPGRVGPPRQEPEGIVH